MPIANRAESLRSWARAPDLTCPQVLLRMPASWWDSVGPIGPVRGRAGSCERQRLLQCQPNRKAEQHVLRGRRAGLPVLARQDQPKVPTRQPGVVVLDARHRVRLRLFALRVLLLCMLSTRWCACGVCSYCPFHPGSLTNCTWDVKQIVKVVDKKCHDQSLWSTVRLASPRLALMLHAEWCMWQVIHDQSHWSHRSALARLCASAQHGCASPAHICGRQG